MSEDSAFKRIRAARAARDFPVILDAVAEGRLHLSAIVLLAPDLREGMGDELLAAAEHKTKAQVEELLARRFPREDVPTRVTPVPAPAPELLTEPHFERCVTARTTSAVESCCAEACPGRHWTTEYVPRSLSYAESPSSVAERTTEHSRPAGCKRRPAGLLHSPSAA